MVVGHIVGHHRCAFAWQRRDPGPHRHRRSDRTDSGTPVNVDIHTAMATMAIDIDVDITDAAAAADVHVDTGVPASGPYGPMRTAVHGWTRGVCGIDERQFRHRRPGKSDEDRPKQIN
jgi:hypothetical protein